MAPRAIHASLIALAQAAACSPSTPSAEAPDGAVDAWSEDASANDAPDFVFGDGGQGREAAMPPLDAGDPPVVACDADAQVDGGPCPAPPSVCADARWLVYYVGGACLSGLCQWEKKFVDCGDCQKGACNVLGTAPRPN